VPLYAISYFSDMNVKLSEKFTSYLASALEQAISSYDLKELSYLLVALKAHSGFDDAIFSQA